MDVLNTPFVENQLTWTALCFAGLAFIVWKFITPAINETLDARAKKIEGDLDRAEKLKNEAEKTLQSYEKQLKNAKSEAADIVAKAKKEAEDMASAKTAELEAELARKGEEARNSIEKAKNAALDELKAEVVEMTMLATQKVIGEAVDKKAATKLTDEALKELVN